MQNLKAGQIFIDTNEDSLSSGEVSVSDLLKALAIIECYLIENEHMSMQEIGIAKAITVLRTF